GGRGGGEGGGKRGVDGMGPAVRHGGGGVGRPRRRPAGAQGREEVRLAVEAEEAFELPREGRAPPILDERGRANCAEPFPDPFAPGSEQRLENRRSDWSLVELELKLDRDAPRFEGLGGRDASRRGLETKLCHLHAVGVGGET